LEAAVFFSRFGGRVDLRGKSVLDFGCGFGSTCFFLAQQGAGRVVGVDTDEQRVAFANHKLASQFSGTGCDIRFGTPDQLGHQRFDVVISQDCFEHYPDPGRILKTMERYLLPGGVVLIGFSPLWKSPYGGHIGYMTKMPWAHLLFPERVIMQERLRYRPDEHARTFSEMRGGLNKMTYERFLRVVREGGFDIEFLDTNVTDSKLKPLIEALRSVPGCFEYLTINLYAVIRTRILQAQSEREPNANPLVSSSKAPVDQTA
jgi:SAM-dependent methyltransferase